MSAITMIEPIELEAQPTPEARPTALQVATPAYLLQLAVQQNADLAKLEKLMDLHERWEANEARKAMVKAMAGFKSEAPTILKSKVADFPSKGGRTVYAYADLAEVVSKISPALAKFDLSHDWSIETEGKVIYVTCTLTHIMGHSKSVTMPAFPDDTGGKNAIQAVASAVSYLEKYTLLAVTGLAASGMDDDGNSAGPRTEEGQQGDKPPGQTQQPAEQQPGRLPEMSPEHFDKNFPAWKAGIDSGRKTPGDVLTTLTTKYTLTQEQKSRIRSCSAVQNAATR